MQFNENEEIIAGFDVTNWRTFPNNSFIRVQIGSLDPRVLSGKELTIHDEIIVWHRTFNQVRFVFSFLGPKIFGSSTIPVSALHLALFFVYIFVTILNSCTLILN